MIFVLLRQAGQSTGTAAIIAANSSTSQQAAPGAGVSYPPQVLVTDSGGNPVSGVTVTFAVTGGGGSGTGLSQTSGSDGLATVTSWTLGASPGLNTMTASSAGLTGSPVTFLANGTSATTYIPNPKAGAFRFFVTGAA